MDVLQPKYWDFIGDGDLTWKDAMLEQRIYFCKVGSAFLRATFELPPGYVIDVLEGPLVVALGWSDDSEPVSDNERDELVRRMVEPLNRFFRALRFGKVGFFDVLPISEA